MDEKEVGMRADGLGHPLLFFRRRRFYIAILACLGYILSYSTRVNLSVAIIYMTRLQNVTLDNGTTVEKREFNWDSDTQGLLLASFFFGYIFTQIPAGYLAGVIGGNHVLNIGIAGSGVASFVCPVCIRFNLMAAIAIRVIIGLFQGLTVPAINSLWARWAPPLERTILSTIAISGNFFSSLFIMPVCGVIGDHMGWEWMFYIFGIVSLVWSVIWGFTIFAGPEIDKFIKASELDYIQRSIGERTDKKPVHPWKKIFSSLPVGAVVVAQTGHNWGYYTLLLYGPKYYFETLGYEMQQATIFTGVAFTISGFLMQIFGQVADTMRRKGIKTLTARKIFCCGGFGIQITFMLLLAFVPHRDCCVAFSILAIGMGGITWSAFNVNALDIAAPHSAIISAVANTCATTSGILAPVFPSLLLPRSHPQMADWMWCWLFCALIYLISVLFFGIFASGEKQSWVYTPPD